MGSIFCVVAYLAVALAIVVVAYYHRGAITKTGWSGTAVVFAALLWPVSLLVFAAFYTVFTLGKALIVASDYVDDMFNHE